MSTTNRRKIDNKNDGCSQRIKSYKNTRHGPSDRIRTCGILLPKQARYQLRYTRLFRYFIRLVVFSPKNQAPYQLDHSRMPVGHYTPSVGKKQPENTYPRTKKKSMNYKITGMPGLP